MRIPEVGDEVRLDYAPQFVGEVIKVEPYQSEVGTNAKVTVRWRPTESVEYAQDLRLEKS